MAGYQTYAVSEAAFFDFIDAPSPTLLSEFVGSLASDGHANWFFKQCPPVWQEDANSWVSDRLPKIDWYIDLTEPEAVAWDHAITRIAAQFTCDVVGTKHGRIHDDIFQLASEIFSDNKTNNLMLRMNPYRYTTLAPEIENTEPSERVYWPTHAMFDTAQLETLHRNLAEFRARLVEFELSFPYVFDSVDERKESADSEAAELSSYLERLLEREAMWLAPIDC